MPAISQIQSYRNVTALALLLHRRRAYLSGIAQTLFAFSSNLVRLRLCACHTTQSCCHLDRGHKRKSRRPAASSLQETHELPARCAPALPSLAGLGKRNAPRSQGARPRTAPKAEFRCITTRVAVRAKIASDSESLGTMQ